MPACLAMSWQSHFRGKNCVVTGGASGIGRAVLTALLQDAGAARVVAVDLNAEALATMKAEVAALPARWKGHAKGELVGDARIGTVVADLSKFERAEDVVAEVATALGGGSIDMWHHNAGIAATGPSLEMGAHKIELMFAINMHAPVHYSRALLAYMAAHPDTRPRDRLDMAVTSSLSAFVAVPRSALYAATKAGVRQFFRSLRREEDLHGLAEFPVNISCFEPGFVRTNLLPAEGFSAIETTMGGLDYTVNQVAAHCLAGLAAGQFDVIMTRKDRVTANLDWFAPGLVTKQLRSQAKRKGKDGSPGVLDTVMNNGD